MSENTEVSELIGVPKDVRRIEELFGTSAVKSMTPSDADSIQLLPDDIRKVLINPDSNAYFFFEASGANPNLRERHKLLTAKPRDRYKLVSEAATTPYGYTERLQIRTEEQEDDSDTSTYPMTPEEAYEANLRVRRYEPAPGENSISSNMHKMKKGQQTSDYYQRARSGIAVDVLSSSGGHNLETDTAHTPISNEDPEYDILDDEIEPESFETERVTNHRARVEVSRHSLIFPSPYQDLSIAQYAEAALWSFLGRRPMNENTNSVTFNTDSDSFLEKYQPLLVSPDMVILKEAITDEGVEPKLTVLKRYDDVAVKEYPSWRGTTKIKYSPVDMGREIDAWVKVNDSDWQILVEKKKEEAEKASAAKKHTST